MQVQVQAQTFLCLDTAFDYISIDLATFAYICIMHLFNRSFSLSLSVSVYNICVFMRVCILGASARGRMSSLSLRI
jgi:hypothetical protein